MSVVTQQAVRSGRVRELALLVVAIGTCLLGWVLVHHGVSVGEVPALPEPLR